MAYLLIIQPTSEAIGLSLSILKRSDVTPWVVIFIPRALIYTFNRLHNRLRET